MKQITHSQLAEIVKNKNGVAFIGLQTLTDAKARKTNNPFGTVWKQSRFVGVSGADYQSAVQRAGAGEFVADSLPWGEFVANSGRKLIAHKGALYLRLQTTGKQRAQGRGNCQILWQQCTRSINARSSCSILARNKQREAIVSRTGRIPASAGQNVQF